MKYVIVYDRPGRIRVRLGMYAFTREQGHGIEQMLLKEEGIVNAEATSANGGLLVLYEGPVRKHILQMIRLLDRNNLPAEKPTDEVQKRELKQEFWTDIIRMTASHYFVKLFMPAPVRLVITLTRAVSFIKRGIRALSRGKLNVEVLDAASVIAAFVQGSPSTASSIMFLLRISDRLEEFTRKQTKQALSESLAMNIDTVWQVTEAGDVKVPLSSIRPEDCVRVHAGTLIPVDGVVAGGDAMVNESSLTGEAAAVHRKEGSTVYAGTAIEEGEIVVRVMRPAGESRISNIVSMIDASELLKAGSQSRAEKLADSIVPFSFITSLAVGLLTRNLTKALSVLMVDYSCALKLSIPISVISAMREAADHKMLVKGGKHLECFENADTILFDKTGTLTSASPKVTKVIAFGEYTEEQVLKDAACLEEHFPHSVARAIVRHAAERGINHLEEHAKVEYVVAHGISTILRGERAQIGSKHFIFEDEEKVLTDEVTSAIREEMQGLSVIYLAVAGKVAGMIGIEDPVREEAAEVIRLLKDSGFRHVIMMTGDGEEAASRVAQQLGIDEYYASVLPEDKAAMVARLKAEGRTVVMVGDGINDSPALSEANVSVAMKDSSDLAREVADITLLTDDLSDLLTLRKISAGMMRRIHGNFAFIMGFNSTLLALGIAGVMAPQKSSVLHNLSTMAISGLSMRPYLRDMTEDAAASPEEASAASAEAVPA